MEAGGSTSALDHRRNAVKQKKRQHTETMARYQQAKLREDEGEQAERERARDQRLPPTRKWADLMRI